MAINFDREEIRRCLEILYPVDHGIIELDVLKKSGHILPGHFDDREKLLDEIEKYDGRDDVLAIYTALNPIKPEAFTRADHEIKALNKVTSGLRIDAQDVARVKGILFDLDPNRGNGDKKDSTTDLEHKNGLEAADSLKHKLALMGWPDPVIGSSGNGSTLRYLTDMPASEDTEKLLSRMLKAANNLLPDHLKKLVEVDGAMFDRPRISKVFGTMTRKGSGTPERPHRRAKLISAPEKLEPVQIDSIMKLVNAGRRSDPIEDTPRPNTSKDRTKPLSEVENDPDIKPCLKAIILNKDIRRLEEVAAHEHKGRVAIAIELILAGYSDEALHEFFSRLEDYDRQITAGQIKQILSKFVEGKGGKTWLCKTLRDTEVIPSEKCEGCKWVGHGQDPLIVLKVLVKAKPREINKPEVLNALADLKRSDSIEYGIFIDELDIPRTAKTEVKKRIESLAEAKPDKKDEKDEPKISPDVLKEAELKLDEGKAFEYVLEVWQKRHHGDENLGKALLLSIGAQSCISSKGVHVHACGPRGLGKSDGTEKASEAIPPSHLLVGSASPKALYYLGARLPAGSVVYLDDIGWNDQAAQMFKTCTTFYKEGATHTVVVDQEIQQFKIAPRIIFWITTADAQTDEQVRDRLLRIDITEDPKHTQEIIDFIFEQRKSGAATFDPHEIEVCRAIIYLLKQKFVDVVIPFAEHIKFYGDPRGATIFADLVSSFAIWRHQTREKDGNGGVIASYEDYKDAETFFNAIKGHSDTKYTPGELRTLQAIKDLHGEAIREMIMEKTGFSKGGLSDILNGRSRDGQAKYGLLHKCPALTEEDEGTLKWIDRDTKTSKKKKVYRLPEDYDILKAYGKAVSLDIDENNIKRLCSESSSKFGDGSQDKNEFGKELVRKFVEYNRGFRISLH